MQSPDEFDAMIDQMKQQSELIEVNRTERNKKYADCLNNYKEFLSAEAEAIENIQIETARCKELISKSFQNTFQRIINSSDVTIRKIKQTYSQKKEFWDNVIKMNANMTDLELKKEFYNQKRNADDNYFEAIDHQKDKHKSYALLMNKVQKKQHLREYQQTNKYLEEKVIEGTNTMQQWQKMTNLNKNLANPYSQKSSAEPTVINKFLLPNQKGYGRKVEYGQGDNSMLFLNNFTRKL